MARSTQYSWMRQKVTAETLEQFMKELGNNSRSQGRVYFTGGVTALLLGFRQQTIDVDIKMDPEPLGAFEAIAQLKNKLNINVELASPAEFIPPNLNWAERSKHIATYGLVEFYHYDFVSQALAKIERGYAQDIKDAEDFLSANHISLDELDRGMEQIKPLLLRYPHIDAATFEKKVKAFLDAHRRS